MNSSTHIDYLFSPIPGYQLFFIIVCADKFVTVLSHSHGSSPLHILLNDLVRSILHLMVAVVIIDTDVTQTGLSFLYLIHVKCSLYLTFNNFLSDKFINFDNWDMLIYIHSLSQK